MNLDELRTVQSKERSKDSLQHLRESFYSDVADYIADLREQRDRAAERSENPFDDPEVNRLTDEIHTAEDVVEAIYERRVGKVVKRASLAAAGMHADEEGLTNEEQRLFNGLVERIESNKEEVLDVLAGEETADAPDSADGALDSPDAGAADLGDASTPTEDASGSSEDVSAADVMGGDSPADSATGTRDTTTAEDADESDGARPAAAEAAAITDAPGESTNEDAGEERADPESEADDPLAGLDERTTVRVTSDVGEIFGVDERTYDLASEDVVTLPETNAEPLVERGAAEKLE